jgi:VPDSG-CTERM motif
MKNHLKIILSTLALAGLQAHGQLVQNGGFEILPLGTDWTFTPAATGSDFNYTHGPAHTGSYAASFGAVSYGINDPSTLDTISQSITTTPGDEYAISYWLDTADGDGRGLGWVQFVSTFGADTLSNLNPPAIVPGYTEYTIDAEASAASTLLSFSGKSVSGWIELDDVSVTDLGPVTQGVPDVASTFGLLGAALAGLTGLRRKLA